MRILRALARFLRAGAEELGFARRPFFMSDNPAYRGIAVGAYTYGRPLIMGADNSDQAKVSIGKFCSIADGVRFLLKVNHPVDSATTYPLSKLLCGDTASPYEWSRGPIKIGHDVWIGHCAVVLGGVEIGDGAIIGAYALVAKSVPAYSICVGNPARVVRDRFDPLVISKLRELRWWDWDIHKIRENAALLCTGDVEVLLERERAESDES